MTKVLPLRSTMTIVLYVTSNYTCNGRSFAIMDITGKPLIFWSSTIYFKCRMRWADTQEGEDFQIYVQVNVWNIHFTNILQNNLNDNIVILLLAQLYLQSSVILIVCEQKATSPFYRHSKSRYLLRQLQICKVIPLYLIACSDGLVWVTRDL